MYMIISLTPEKRNEKRAESCIFSYHAVRGKLTLKDLMNRPQFSFSDDSFLETLSTFKMCFNCTNIW